MQSDAVSLISLISNSIVQSIPVGSMPSAIAYDSGMGEVAVANSGDGTLDVINDTAQIVVATLPVGPQTNGVAYDEIDHLWLVTSEAGNSVSAINDSTNQVYTILGTGTAPIGVVYSSGTIVVANFGSSSISVIKWTYKATATIWLAIQ
jgi:YVTN family beta-propeller protein